MRTLTRQFPLDLNRPFWSGIRLAGIWRCGWQRDGPLNGQSAILALAGSLAMRGVLVQADPENRI